MSDEESVLEISSENKYFLYFINDIKKTENLVPIILNNDDNIIIKKNKNNFKNFLINFNYNEYTDILSVYNFNKENILDRIKKFKPFVIIKIILEIKKIKFFKPLEYKLFNLNKPLSKNYEKKLYLEILNNYDFTYIKEYGYFKKKYNVLEYINLYTNGFMFYIKTKKKLDFKFLEDYLFIKISKWIQKLIKKILLYNILKNQLVNQNMIIDKQLFIYFVILFNMIIISKTDTNEYIKNKISKFINKKNRKYIEEFIIENLNIIIEITEILITSKKNAYNYKKFIIDFFFKNI